MNRKEPIVAQQRAPLPLTVFDSANLFTAPRDPATKAPMVGLSPVMREVVSRQQSPPTKKRVDFAGGFKVPEEVMARQQEKKKPLMHALDDDDQLDGDNQLTKEEIMAQLNLNQNASKFSSNKMGLTKEQTKKDLVFGIDKEMEKLRRQAENIGMRREMARRLEEGLKPKDGTEPTLADLEAQDLQKDIRALGPVHNIVHAHPERVQMIRHKVTNLGIENLNPDQVEQLRKKHEQQLKECEERYFKKKQSEQLLRKYEPNSYLGSQVHSGSGSPRRPPPVAAAAPTRSTYVPPPKVSSSAIADLPTCTGHSPGKIDPSKPLKPDEQRYVDKFRRYQLRKSREGALAQSSPEPEEFDLYTSGPDSPSRKGRELKELAKEMAKPGSTVRPSSFFRSSGVREDMEGTADNASTLDRAPPPYFSSDNDGSQKPAGVTFADPPVRDSPKLKSRRKSPSLKSPVRSPQRQRSARGGASMRPAEKKAFHLLKWVFNSIDQERSGKVAKNKLVDEVKKGHEEILDIFSVKTAIQLERKLARHRTADPTSFTWQEFVELALEEYDTAGLLGESPKKKLDFTATATGPCSQLDDEPAQAKGTRILPDHVMHILHRVFGETDKYQDHVLKRKDLLYALRTHPDVVEHIDEDAVLTADLGVKLNLDEVLGEVEYDEREERKKKESSTSEAVITREFITWNQFKAYFTHYRSREERALDLEEETGTQYRVPVELLPSEMRYGGGEEAAPVDTIDPEDVVECNFQVMDQLREAFDKVAELEGGAEEVDVLELLIEVRNLPGFREFQHQHARAPTEHSPTVKREKVIEVLERIETQWTEKSGISWMEFEAHFTRWGVPREIVASAPPLSEDEQPQQQYLPQRDMGTIRETPTEEEEMTMTKTRPRARSQDNAMETTGPKRGPQAIRRAAEKGDLSQVRLEVKDYTRGESGKPRRSLSAKRRGSQPPAITVPQPFGFMRRDQSKTRSIRELRVAEMVAEKDEEEQAAINYQFRHREPPPEVTNNRYRALMEAEKQRREEVRANSQAILKSKEKPFSFYERDLEKQRLKSQEAAPLPSAMQGAQFRAKEIPRAVQSQLYKKMDDEQEKKRKQRIAHNAQMSFAKAKLPPRMEMHEKMKKQQKELGLTKSKQLSHSFKPKIHKDVPDFDQKYKEFMAQLEKKRQQKRGTEIKPFNFNECKKSLGLRKYLDEDNQDKGNPIPKPVAAPMRRPMPAQPAILPASTKKTEEMRAKRRKQMEASRKQEQERAKTAQAVEAKHSKKNEMFERIKGSDALVDNSKKLEEKRKEALESKKREFREKTKAWEENKKQMYEKVKQRPLLMEMATQKKSGMLAEMKELKRVRDTMRKNGVDPEKFMSAAELEKAEDAAFLEKHGKA